MNTSSTTFITTPVTQLNGEITVPGDKSISHRALMLSAIATGQSVVHDMLMGADNLATMRALQQLGVNIIAKNNCLLIDGVGMHGLRGSESALDLGNAGTGIRLMTGLLAGQSFDAVLTGDESLCRRPMRRIIGPLQQMGAEIQLTDQGTPPIHIVGEKSLMGIEYTMPMASAQVKSCLLLAGLYAKGRTTIIEPGFSRDHTERLLQGFGYELQTKPLQVSLQGGGKLHATEVHVPGDISSAAFFLVAASIIPGSDIILKNVGINPTRVGVINILKKMGADITMHNQRDVCNEPVADIQVRYAILRGIDIPSDQVPLAIDEFPILFIAAACARGTTKLTGAAELRVKESDRLSAMAEGLTKLGITNQLYNDGIAIEGGALQGGVVDSFDDHRISMAFAIAGAVAKETITITNCDNVITSFPQFIDCAQSLGLQLKEEFNHA